MEKIIRIIDAKGRQRTATIKGGDVLDLDHGEHLYLDNHADYHQLIREGRNLIIPYIHKKIITIKNFFHPHKTEKTIWFNHVCINSHELANWLTYPLFIVNKNNVVMRQLFITHNNPVNPIYFNLSEDEQITTTAGTILNINNLIVPTPLGKDALWPYISCLVSIGIIFILLFN